MILSVHVLVCPGVRVQMCVYKVVYYLVSLSKSMEWARGLAAGMSTAQSTKI